MGKGNTDDDDRSVRRARTIRRYASLDAPTRDETEAAARELGTSTTYLSYLARAWRVHGSTGIRMGAVGRDPVARAAAVAAAEGELDLSDFEPDSHDEIRRRISVIGRYLRTGTRERRITDRFASEYGAKYDAFRKAATAWLLSPRPENLPGLGLWTLGRNRARHLLPPEANEAVRTAFGELGLHASRTAIYRRVVQLCRAAGVAPPSRGLIDDRLRAALASVVRPGPDLSLCLDRTATDLAAPGAVPVLLTMLFGTPSGRIYGYEAHTASPSPAIDARVLASAASLASPAWPVATMLEMSVPNEGRWTELTRALEANGVTVLRTATGVLASTRLSLPILGNRIDDLALRRMDHRHVDAFDPEEGLPDAFADTLRRAIASHNALRDGDVPIRLADATDGPLLSELRTIGAEGR